MITNPCGVAHFQNKPCKRCDEARAKALANLEAHIPVVKFVEMKEIHDAVKSGEISDTVAGIALTAAERHKRFREKHGDAYREANRLRMREKRKRDG